MPPRRSARTKAPTNYKDPPAPAEDESELSSVEDTDDAGVDSDKEEEYVAKKPTPKNRAKKPAAPKKGGGGGRKKKAVIGGVDLRIESDNQLWNWVSAFQSEEDEEGEAMSVLINFVLRVRLSLCCGCNGVVDRYEAIDVDGIVDKLDDIQTAHMAAPDLGYPLIHKKPPLSKVLRPNLTEFFNTLLETLHSTDLLHTTQFIDTFSPWLVSLSSSRLRSFRHTSTFLALLFVQALCSVGEEVGGELRKASVARENEQKRLEGMRGKKDKGRLREFEKRAEEADQRKEKIEEACKDIFHG
ncbi:STAG-domain-containing protein, partial [Atractiella rhizophila]